MYDWQNPLSHEQHEDQILNCQFDHQYDYHCLLLALGNLSSSYFLQLALEVALEKVLIRHHYWKDSLLSYLKEEQLSGKWCQQTSSENNYGTKIYIQSGHLYLLAFSESKDSSCPIIVAIDQGFSYGDGEFLVPHVSVLDEVPDEGLPLDHAMTLGSLSRVVSDLNLVDHTIPMNEYNLLNIHCGTFFLHLFEMIGFDYKEIKANTEITKYVSKSLAADESTVIAICKENLKENMGRLQQAKFHLWNFYVRDEEMTRELVRNNMNSTEQIIGGGIWKWNEIGDKKQ